MAMRSRESRPMRGVWDLETKFPPAQIAAALSRVWAVDRGHLVPAVDSRGEAALCPITVEPFQEPVLLADGFVYEQASILQWLESNTTAPCTNVELQHRLVLRLAPLKAMLDTFLASSEQPVAKETSNTGSHAALEDILSAAEEQLSMPSLGLLELMAASRALDTGLAKGAAEIEVLQGLLDQGRRLSEKLCKRLKEVSRGCIASNICRLPLASSLHVRSSQS